MQTYQRMVHWTDGQSDMSLCIAEDGESDADAIARGAAILAEQGGEVGDGKIVVGEYRE